MGACQSCRSTAGPSASAATLFQIRQGYCSRWNDLTFSIETASGDWTLRVQDSARNETLYTAHRREMEAAKIAAAEFGIFQVLGVGSQVSPNELASELNWQRYW